MGAGVVDGHALPQRVRQLPDAARGRDAAPGDGLLPQHARQRPRGPVEGKHPNENYARELEQLFSIGLVKLNLDGTPAKDAQGKTTPTYDQSVVEGFARVFTGWNFAGNNTASNDDW